MSSKSKLFDVFISHSSSDARVARTICDYLEKHRNTCWIAPRNIYIGTDYAEQIIKGLESSKVLLIILSEMANKSEQVLREVERATSKKLPIIVFAIEPIKQLSKSLEYFLTHRQWIMGCTESGKLCITKDVLFQLSCVVEKFIHQVDSGEEDIGLEYEPMSNFNYQKRSNLYFRIAVISLSVIAFWLGGLFSDDIAKYYFPNDDYKKNVKNDDTLSNQKSIASTKLKPGDIISYGSYRDKPILWSVMNAKAGIVKLVAYKPISYKPFDVAHSGYYDKVSKDGTPIGNHDDEMIANYLLNYIRDDDGISYVKARGSSDWRSSTLRSWLNSRNINVKYHHGIPSINNINDSILKSYNSEDSAKIAERGFLSNFTENEFLHMVVQKGDFLFLFNTINCQLYDEPIMDKKVSDVSKFKKHALSFLMKNFTGCYNLKYNEYVTIPDISDLDDIVKVPEVLVSFNYKFDVNIEQKNLPYTTSFWLKNACGYTPSSVCSIIGSKDNPKVIKVTIKEVTNLDGVLPIININIRRLRLMGNGDLLSPYKVIWDSQVAE
ncbi:MAG: toll/interleukin-1 receptor domain-containing protein [Succinivibrionaceae bacterium]